MLAEVADGDEHDAWEMPLLLLLLLPFPLPLRTKFESFRMLFRRCDGGQESLRELMLPLVLWLLLAVAEAGRRPRFFTSRL
jgi:hypothetical protein